MTVPKRLKAGNVRNAGNVAGDNLQWIRQPMWVCVWVCVCVTNIEQKHPETSTDCISKMDATCDSLVGKPIRSRASLRVFKALWNSEPENLTSGTEKNN